MTQPHTTEPPGPQPEPQTTEPQQTRPRLPGWARVLLALIAFMIAAYSPGLTDLIGPLREGARSTDPLLGAKVQALVQLTPLPFYLLFTFLLTRCADRRPMRVTGLALNRRALLGLLAGTRISVAVVGCITAVFLLLGIGTWTPGTTGKVLSVLPLWLVVTNSLLFSYAFQGIGEEAVMRGYLLQSLSDRPKRAVWVAAIVFTIPHLLSQGGQQSALDRIFYLIDPFGLALAAAYLALIMRSTWAAIGIHGGLHLGRRLMPIVTGVDLPNGRLVWIASGLVFCAIAALLASRISKQRWTEIAARGPYAPPL